MLLNDVNKTKIQKLQIRFFLINISILSNFSVQYRYTDRL